MLKEAEIRTFIEGTTNYFETTAQQPATVGSPYLVTDGNPGAYEYTGVIGISGSRKGIVYFTAPRGMLTVLLMRMQETDTSDDNIKDLVGEVANTISGNARPIDVRPYRSSTSRLYCCVRTSVKDELASVGSVAARPVRRRRSQSLQNST